MKNNVEIRNIFYRNNFPKLFFLMIIMIFINLVLAGLLMYFVTHIPKPQNYASNPDGKNTVLYALDQPLVSQKALLEWANQAAISIFYLDYLTYPAQIKNISTYFSPVGWSLFQNDFRNIINTVISKKLRVSSVTTGTPVIMEQGVLLGQYSWKIRMPLLVTYESASQTTYQRLMVDMVIMRVSTLVSPKGIAIAQFYTGERPPQFK